MMSNPTELLQAAVHALKTEKDSERAKQLSAEILDTYPDSKEAGRARMIIDEIDAVAVWLAKKTKQTKETEGSPATSATKSFFGVLVFLVAVGGVVLMLMSGQEPSLPQIEGHDGNPIVGRINAVSGVVGFIETLMFLIAGGALLVISLIGFAILRFFKRPKAK